MIESKSGKTRISAPAHPTATGGRVSGLVFLSAIFCPHSCGHAHFSPVMHFSSILRFVLIIKTQSHCGIDLWWFSKKRKKYCAIVNDKRYMNCVYGRNLPFPNWLFLLRVSSPSSSSSSSRPRPSSSSSSQWFDASFPPPPPPPLRPDLTALLGMDALPVGASLSSRLSSSPHSEFAPPPDVDKPVLDGKTGIKDWCHYLWFKTTKYNETRLLLATASWVWNGLIENCVKIL